MTNVEFSNDEIDHHSLSIPDFLEEEAVGGSAEWRLSVREIRRLIK